MKKPYIIAIVGKGGVGKTVITALMAKIISQNYNLKLLLIDADPTHPHLSKILNLIPKKSIESIRAEVIKKSISKEKSIRNLAESIDFEVYDAIAESKEFSLFSIGQPEGPGCFCPSNALLRKVIESISKDFDMVLIDCEAGLEQINRMVLESVDLVLIITDLSIRSIETADSIRNSAKSFTNYKNLYVILNKVRGNIENLYNKLKELEMPLLGEISEDPEVLKLELQGQPLLDLPEDSKSLLEIKELVKKIVK